MLMCIICCSLDAEGPWSVLTVYPRVPEVYLRALKCTQWSPNYISGSLMCTPEVYPMVPEVYLRVNKYNWLYMGVPELSLKVDLYIIGYSSPSCSWDWVLQNTMQKVVEHDSWRQPGLSRCLESKWFPSLSVWSAGLTVPLMEVVPPPEKA